MSDIKKSLSEEIEDLEKAKYIKREGTKGNYKYTYTDKEKPQKVSIQTLKDMASKHDSFDSFVQDLENIKHIPRKVINEFFNKYGDDGKPAVKRLFDEVKGNKPTPKPKSTKENNQKEDSQNEQNRKMLKKWKQYLEHAAAYYAQVKHNNEPKEKQDKAKQAVIDAEKKIKELRDNMKKSIDGSGSLDNIKKSLEELDDLMKAKYSSDPQVKEEQMEAEKEKRQKKAPFPSMKKTCMSKKAKKSMDGSGSLDKCNMKKKMEKGRGPDKQPRKKRSLSVPEKHQLKIARATLKMSPEGANIMGGMNHEEAKKVISRLTKAAPKGVEEAKYKRCKDEVKKEGKVDNPYAVCAASLKKAQEDDTTKQKLNDIHELLQLPDFYDHEKDQKISKAISVIVDAIKDKTENAEEVAKALVDSFYPEDRQFFQMQTSKFDITEDIKENEVLQFEEELQKCEFDASDEQEVLLTQQASELTEQEKIVKMNIENAFGDVSEDLEKAKTGEGSRGGKIIGHTKSGKPIYEANKKDSNRMEKNPHKMALKVFTTLLDSGQSKKARKFLDEVLGISEKNRRSDQILQLAQKYVKVIRTDKVNKSLDEVIDLEKAKYIKREGTSGNYKYTYADGKQGTKESIPGLDKDKKDLKQMKENLKTLEAGGKVENLSIEGAKRAIQGLEGAIANKLKDKSPPSDKGAVKQDKNGRWFISMGQPGFNSPANNRTGYDTEASARAAHKRYSSKRKESASGNVGTTRSGKKVMLHEAGSAQTIAGGIHSSKFKGWTKEDHADAFVHHALAANKLVQSGAAAGDKNKDFVAHQQNKSAHYYHMIKDIPKDDPKRKEKVIEIVNQAHKEMQESSKQSKPKKMVYGTRDNKWHEVGPDDRDYKHALTKEEFKELGEKKAKEKYLKPRML